MARAQLQNECSGIAGELEATAPVAVIINGDECRTKYFKSDAGGSARRFSGGACKRVIPVRTLVFPVNRPYRILLLSSDHFFGTRLT